MNNSKKNVVVIGYGGMGGWHTRFILQNNVVNLLGIYDIKPERAKLAEENGIHAYGSWEEVLADEAVAFVVLAVPNELHKPLAIEAMSRGKHVVSEKPVTLCSEDLQEMIDKKFLIGPKEDLGAYIDKVNELLVMTDFGTGKPLEPLDEAIKRRKTQEKIKSESDSIKAIRKAVLEIEDEQVRDYLFEMSGSIGKIEKKLKESGKIQQAESLHEITDLFTEEGQEEQDVYKEPVLMDKHEDVVIPVKIPEMKPVTVEGQRSLHKSAVPARSSAKKTVAKRPPILQEEVKTKKKEKIDPKKLVIYSEIMKPKYQE